MKKLILAALVALNLIVLSALWIGPAYAQAVPAGQLVMLVGRWQANSDAVYVLHLGRQELMGWRLDPATRKLAPFRKRSLDQDFAGPLVGAQPAAPPPEFQTQIHPGGVQRNIQVAPRTNIISNDLRQPQQGPVQFSPVEPGPAGQPLPGAVGGVTSAGGLQIATGAYSPQVDVLYVLDARGGRLNVYTPNPQANSIDLVDSLDVEQAFGQQ